MCDPGRLEGKTAIITGAANGIGKACAIIFAREGCRLALADRDEEALQKVQEQVKSAGGTAAIRKTDVSIEDEVKALIDLALSTYTNVDILVNNAGISGGLYDLDAQDTDEWRMVYAINVLGPVYSTKHIINHMKQRRAGSIVNVGAMTDVILIGPATALTPDPRK